MRLGFSSSHTPSSAPTKRPLSARCGSPSLGFERIPSVSTGSYRRPPDVANLVLQDDAHGFHVYPRRRPVPSRGNRLLFGGGCGGFPGGGKVGRGLRPARNAPIIKIISVYPHRAFSLDILANISHAAGSAPDFLAPCCPSCCKCVFYLAPTLLSHPSPIFLKS